MHPNTVIAMTTATLLSTSTALGVSASQSEIKRGALCSGLEGQPQCCAVSLWGIADLQCTARWSSLSLSYSLSFSSNGEEANNQMYV